MILELIEDIIDETVGVWQDAKHDWYFAKRQMDSMQRTNLRRDD